MSRLHWVRCQSSILNHLNLRVIFLLVDVGDIVVDVVVDVVFILSMACFSVTCRTTPCMFMS